MILVDTSVLVEHLRRGHEGLAHKMEHGEVACPWTLHQRLGRIARAMNLHAL